MDFWSALTRMFYQGSLELINCAIISIMNTPFSIMETGTDGDKFSFVMAYFILIMVCFLPFLILYRVCINYEKLDDPITRKKYGMFYPEVNLAKRTSAIYYAIFVGRRLLYAIIINYLQKYPMWQMFMIISMNLSYVAYMINEQPI